MLPSTSYSFDTLHIFAKSGSAAQSIQQALLLHYHGTCMTFLCAVESTVNVLWLRSERGITQHHQQQTRTREEQPVNGI